jgi:hypothetical protein
MEDGGNQLKILPPRSLTKTFQMTHFQPDQSLDGQNLYDGRGWLKELEPPGVKFPWNVIRASQHRRKNSVNYASLYPILHTPTTIILYTKLFCIFVLLNV